MTEEDLKNIYAELGIDTADLGCAMLDTETITVSDIIDEDLLFFSKDPKKFWINGIVCEWRNPHVTLLCGLMAPAHIWKDHIDTLLKDVSIPELVVDEVSYFDSAYEEEQYYCVIAKIKKDENLINANNLLKKLPHISSFPEYTPHVTLAYIKKDEDTLTEIINKLNSKLKNSKIKTTRMNYGE